MLDGLDTYNADTFLCDIAVNFWFSKADTITFSKKYQL